MRLLSIGLNEEGQRADKLLSKYLPLAPKSFFYKMMRKKNITLNDKKISGSERLREGDLLRLWISDEVLDSFRLSQARRNQSNGRTDLFSSAIVYEDDHLLVLNKPSGMLTQKETAEGISLNELFLQYLAEKREIDRDSLSTFTPSVCHRLDRNTSGILFFGKSFPALRQMSRLMAERSIEKYYLCIVRGDIKDPIYAKDFLLKEERNNRVHVCDRHTPGAREAESHFFPLHREGGYTLLKVRIFSGRSHQIRVQLSHRGYPIVGDAKYGFREKGFRGAGRRGQWLHSWMSILPSMEPPLSELSGKYFIAPPPELFLHMMKGFTWEHGKQGD